MRITLLACLALAALALTGAPALAASPAARVDPPVDPPVDPTFTELDALLEDATRQLNERDLVHGDMAPDPLLDRLGVDLPCGTVLARAARRAMPRVGPMRRGDLARIVPLPRLLAASQHAATADGFVIYHELTTGSRQSLSRRDADGDGVPDALAALADDVRLATSWIAESLAWTPRHASPDGLLQVYVGATPFREGALVQGTRLVVPVQLDGTERLLAVAHQVAHLAIDQVAPDLPPSLEEALATFLGRAVVLQAGAAVDDDAGVGTGLRPSRALLSPGLFSARADARFFQFLDESADLPASWLAETLALSTARIEDERRLGLPTSAASARAAAVDSLDEVLGRHGSSVADAVSAFHLWELRADLAAQGVAVPVDLAVQFSAVEITGHGSELPPFGQARFGIEVPADGGLRIAFEGDDRAEAHVAVLLDDGSIRMLPLRPGLTGERLVSLPTGRLHAVVVLVQAPTIPADWTPWDAPDAAIPAPGDFALSVLVDPRHPFVLDGLGAETRPGQVTLDWTTSSEDDLRWWIVERSIRSAGPFTRVSAVPLPALSVPGEPASYSFIDDTVRPGTRYHYRIGGMTSAGLTELSPPLTVRTLPAGPEVTAADRTLR